MGRSDAVLTVVGGALGVLAGLGLLLVGWLRACERASERGFGG